LKRLFLYVTIAFIFVFFAGCAGVEKRPAERINSLGLADISDGLPRDGLWRQEIALADMNNDGYLDIVAPLPRKGPMENRPYIFLRQRDGTSWKEGDFKFPPLKDYGYGGIAVGDINRDGYPDIVLAVHSGRIILLENDKNNGFIERPFPRKDAFHSRTIVVSDINGDGWPDVIALSEAPFYRGAKQADGILVGINKEGKNWEVNTVGGSNEMFGDSMAAGDVNGDGKTDIGIAPLIGEKEKVKFIWFGDGKGNFSAYNGSFVHGDAMSMFVRAGDLDGDGKDEVVFKISGFGEKAKVFLAAYKWTGEGFADISKGLEAVENPIVFDLSDVDGDGKKELVVLSTDGIRVYKYTDKGWVGHGYYQLSSTDTFGAYDLRAGRNADGSVVIAYNLGSEEEAFGHGLRAYLMKPATHK
jgi:hypothetical protein